MAKVQRSVLLADKYTKHILLPFHDLHDDTSAINDCFNCFTAPPDCNENHLFFSSDFLIGNLPKLPQRIDKNHVNMHKKNCIVNAKALPFFLSDRFVVQT